MEIVPKVSRPGSYRLNYDDFSEVFRGPFVAGTIKAINSVLQQSVEGGTGQLELFAYPVVTVTVNGTDYENIPLFYCPKKEYWDLPSTASFDLQAHQAQDFDSKKNYYYNAWMSFRKGDEVLVVCQTNEDGGNLTPYAVLGFVDRVPRPGEDIVQWSVAGSNPAYYQLSKDSTYQSTPPGTGPDGLKLNLETSCQIFPIQGSGPIFSQLKTTFYGFFTWRGVVSANPSHPPDLPAGSLLEENLSLWSQVKTEYQWFNFVALVPIGPYLYRFAFNVYYIKFTYYPLLGLYQFFNWGVCEAYGGSVPNPGPNGGEDINGVNCYVPAWFLQANQPYSVIDQPPPDGAASLGWGDIPCNNVQPPAEYPYSYPPRFFLVDPSNYPLYFQFPWEGETAYIFPYGWGGYGPMFQYYYRQGEQMRVFCPTKVQNTDSSPNPYEFYDATPGTIGPGYQPLTGIVDAAMYDPALLNQPQSNEFTSVDKYPGDFFNALEALTSAQAQALLNNPASMVQLSVRPHSKSELQAAGLWPFNN
jgi:hypothetical protein